jgi:hypothetical protein
VSDVWTANKDTVMGLYGKTEEPAERIQEIMETKSALKKIATQYTIEAEEGVDMKTFLERSRKPVVKLLEKFGNIKFHTKVECMIEKRNPDDGGSTESKSSFRATTRTKLIGDHVDDLYDDVVREMMRNFIQYQKKGSWWVLKRVERLTIHVTVQTTKWVAVHSITGKY